MNPLTHPHRLVTAGALGITLTTAAEVLTAPYSSHVEFFGLNPAVHVLKVLAAVGFVVGMLALANRHRAGLGRVGVGAARAVAVGTALGAVPYSVVEVWLGSDRDPAEAAAWLDAAYEAQLAWIAIAAVLGMLLILVGMISLAVVVLRRGLLPRWRPFTSLAAWPLAVAAAVLGEATSLPVPHPPTWLFLCLGIAYAAPLADGAGRGPRANLRRGRVPGDRADAAASVHPG